MVLRLHQVKYLLKIKCRKVALRKHSSQQLLLRKKIIPIYRSKNQQNTITPSIKRGVLKQKTKMTEEKEINSYEYAYAPEQEILLNGIAVLAMIDLLSEVVSTQPNMFASLVYPGKTEEVTDKDGKLIMVNTEWKEHTPDSFFTTAVQEGGALPGMTALALKCEQLRYALNTVHLQNIKSGLAKKVTDLQKEDVLSNIS